MTSLTNALPVDGRNRKVGLIAFGVALAMLGLGYASVPLYRLFCQVTGFGGTTQRTTEEEASRISITDGAISVRFDANTDRTMPWTFRPEQLTASARLGERRMAVYVARNDSDRPITGVATFNVVPEAAGKYFNKIQCFCFNEQTLQPGQEVRMPVIYFVDPAIRDDVDAKAIEQVTLSYTFHESLEQPADAGAKALDRAASGG